MPYSFLGIIGEIPKFCPKGLLPYFETFFWLKIVSSKRMMESTNTLCTNGTFGDGQSLDMSLRENAIDDFGMSYMVKGEIIPNASIRKENSKGSGSLESTAISHEETVDVHRFKILVLLVLFFVVVIVSPLVFAFITKTEQSQFEQKFQKDASKILEAVRMSIDNTLMPMDSLALALVAHARAQNDTWPFVTIPSYGARVAKMLPLADSIWISVLPIVNPADRVQWEDYSRSHDIWVEESFSIQDKWAHYYGPKNISLDREPSEQISGNSGPLDANIRCDNRCFTIQFSLAKTDTTFKLFQSRIMMPQWQTFPSVPMVNTMA